MRFGAVVLVGLSGCRRRLSCVCDLLTRMLVADASHGGVWRDRRLSQQVLADEVGPGLVGLQLGNGNAGGLSGLDALQQPRHIGA